MHLKVPPPVIGLITALAIWAVNASFPGLRMPSSLFSSLGMLCAIVGLIIELISVFLFLRAKTTVNPLSPHNTRHLVTTGIYRYSRNPMYLGMLLLLSGFVLWLSQPLGLVFLLLFVGYITKFQIKPEEGILLENFGEEYANYQQRVRRWL